MTLSIGPLAAQSFTFNGHAYELVQTQRNWADAKADAASRSVGGEFGFLAEIGSQSENNAIFNELSTLLDANALDDTTAPDGGGSAYIWLGANDLDTEGTWLWDNSGDQFWDGGPSGSVVGGRYANWGKTGGTQNEPDNFDSGVPGFRSQNVGAIAMQDWPNGTAGQWNDLSENNTLFSLVEFNTVPEPSEFALFAGLAALILGLCRRRIRCQLP